MENNKKRVAMRVYGKVQGVFFRASTQEKAEELGLTGFVKNEKDGSVYLEAEGDLAGLSKLEQWVQKGPEKAQVEKVEIEEKDSLSGFKGFEQRRS
jgi:acylphosphatase